MLILTEKPSIAKDFAKALGCSYSSADKCYKNSAGTVFITNCVGHLFELEEPSHYGSEFKSWKNLPVIPNTFDYKINSNLKDAASVVIKQLKKHKNDEILIATDADREGEIIARECLNEAGISDYSRIKRFWVSQALTPDVIKDGIDKAKALGLYNDLSAQGFARQHSDWLVGMNATRFITNKAGSVLPVGRVQTAVLTAIDERCRRINNFKSEKYYEIYGTFEPSRDGQRAIKGLFSANDGSTKFKTASIVQVLNSFLDSKATLLDLNSEKKTQLPPQLYSLNDLQKDSYRYFGYSADKTLKLVQKLYEEYKCVSYPRTPSKVMGSKNVQLCSDLYQEFLASYPEYFELHSVYKVDPTDKRLFNDAKLEAHHAIIPLDKLPANATGEEENVYLLILERFMLAFAPGYEYEKQSAKLDVRGNQFVIEGRKVLNEGWKKYRRFTRNFGLEEDKYQDLDGINWNDLYFRKCESEEKFTKPPKHFNEATILAFMENPKNDDSDSKLAGLGTPATRHTFIPKLLKSKYIEISNKNIVITKQGETVLKLLNSSPLSNLANIGETTRWEEELSAHPEQFLNEIKCYIHNAICENRGGKPNEQ